MRLIINGEDREMAAAHLNDVLSRMDLADAVVATAVNGDFVPKARRAAHRLEPGDRIEIVAPMKGG